MKNRTLVRVLLISLTTLAFIMYNQHVPWQYIGFIHFIGGLAAYYLVLGNRRNTYQDTDWVEWFMVFMGGFCGFFSLIVASLPEFELEAWDNIRDE